MVSPRKGRTTVCCVILLMHTIIMVEVARNLVSHITASLSSPLLHGESSRRGLRETSSFHAPTIKSKSEKEVQMSNDFLDRFEDTLANNPTSASASTSNFAALILKEEEGKIYCRKSQIKNLSRSRYFVQMLRQGLKQQQQHIASSEVASQSGLPILIKHDDSNGCYPDTQTDKYGFPRLTWSIPAGNATNHAQNIRQSKPSSWCSAIGMPPYKTWRDIKGRDAKGADYEEHYPWNTKLSKAVWRGATTCNKGMYGHLTIEDIPRSKLVQSSLQRPDLIDAGYHKFVGKYQDVGKEDESRKRMLKESIILEDMMKYKAIIDIDGNNWSARFSTLLCMNSVIIKIQPDFVEQYYHNLKPNVHYIPASLDNITQVVAYVVDKDHDLQMKDIVKNANQWCQRSRTGVSLAKNAISTLDEYRNSLDAHYGSHWMKTWNKILTMNGIDDLVECKV